MESYFTTAKLHNSTLSYRPRQWQSLPSWYKTRRNENAWGFTLLGHDVSAFSVSPILYKESLWAAWPFHALEMTVALLLPTNIGPWSFCFHAPLFLVVNRTLFREKIPMIYLWKFSLLPTFAFCWIDLFPACLDRPTSNPVKPRTQQHTSRIGHVVTS